MKDKITPTMKQMRKRIDAERARVAKVRDRIRALKEEVEALEDDADCAEDCLRDAVMAIDNAGDYLSRNV